MIKKYILKIAGIFVLMIAAIGVLTGAVSYPAPTSNFFINDFANVISDSDENEILQKGIALYNATKAQVVVVTVDSLEGMQVNDYALNLGNEWGVGEAKNDTGIVLLLSVGDRQTTVQVGYGLEGAVNDAKAGRILDTYALPYFRVDEFSTGLKGAYAALVNEVYTEFGLTENIDENYTTENLDGEKVSPFQFIGTAILAVIVIIIFIRNPRLFLYLIAFGGRGGRFGGGRGSGGGFSGGGGRFGGGGASRGGF